MQTCSHILSVKFEACRRDDRKQKKAARHNTSERADASNCKTFNVAHTKTCARAVAGRICSTSGSLPNSKSALCRPVSLPSLHASGHKFIDNSGKSGTHALHTVHTRTHAHRQIPTVGGVLTPSADTFEADMEPPIFRKAASAQQFLSVHTLRISMHTQDPSISVGPVRKMNAQDE